MRIIKQTFRSIIVIMTELSAVLFVHNLKTEKKAQINLWMEHENLHIHTITYTKCIYITSPVGFYSIVSWPLGFGMMDGATTLLRSHDSHIGWC